MSDLVLQNQELIKISETEMNNVKVQTVNARELHSFLEVGRKFSTWIKDRIEKYEFVENQDFIIISQNRETIGKNGHNKVSVAIEYYVTLDMAKELSMVERNKQGRLVVKYIDSVVHNKTNTLNNIYSKPLTMSSVEIAELCDKEHYNVLADIRKMLSDLGMSCPEFSGQYKDKSGKSNPCYYLPKRECMILVSGYNVNLRAKIVDRWLELEDQIKAPVLPSTYIEALEALLASEKEKQILLIENKKQAKLLEEAEPKVTYHDLVLNCQDLMTITQISQDYPISNQKLNRILQEEGIQYKDKSGVWCVYAKHSSKGVCQTSTHVYKDSKGVDHAKLHLKWTQKGRLFIYDLLKSKGILPNIELDDYVPPPMPEEELITGE